MSFVAAWMVHAASARVDEMRLEGREAAAKAGVDAEPLAATWEEVAMAAELLVWEGG